MPDNGRIGCQRGPGHDDAHGQGDGGVDENTAHDGEYHQTCALGGRELEFFRRLRDGVKAHEKPGGNGCYCRYGRQCGFVGGKPRTQIFQTAVRRAQGPDDDDDDADGKNDRQKNLDLADNIRAAVVEQPEDDKHSFQHEQFARVDVPSGNGVHVPDFQNAGEKKARQQDNGRGVEGDDAQVAENQGPPADE